MSSKASWKGGITMSLEEELQQRAEKGELFDSEKDDVGAKAYVELFKVLQNAPGYDVPAKFADNVMDKIIVERLAKASIFSNDYFWFSIGLITLMTMAITAAILTDFKIDMGFLNNMSSYKGLLIFGAMFITALHMLDKRLIKKRS